eukprot:UN24073
MSLENLSDLIETFVILKLTTVKIFLIKLRKALFHCMMYYTNQQRDGNIKFLFVKFLVVMLGGRTFAAKLV